VFQGYSSAILGNSFGGDIIDVLDTNRITQLMDFMVISTSHRLELKATFASWKMNPDAFLALASAKVARVKQLAARQCDECVQAGQDDAAKKVQEEAAAAREKVCVCSMSAACPSAFAAKLKRLTCCRSCCCQEIK